MKKENKPQLQSPLFQVLVPPRGRDKKLCSCTADRGSGRAGVPNCRTRVLFHPQGSHLSECRLKSVDASGKYYSGKTEQVSAKYPGTESDNVTHNECGGLIHSFTNY